MKSKSRRNLAIVLLIAFLVGVGTGPALAQERTKININTATVDELCTLKRIGPSYAQRIVDYRKAHGPFQNPEDVMNVQGIGTRTFEANKDIITCK